MAIDFSFLENVAPKQQEEAPVVDTSVVNVVVQVDADCNMYCDGELINMPLNAGMVTKVQITPGNHFLQFISSSNPALKVEKEVCIPKTDQNFILRINEFASQMPQQPQMPPQNAYLDQLNQMARMNPLAGMGMPQMPPMPGNNK